MKINNEHPPIPPNCKYFHIDPDGDTRFLCELDVILIVQKITDLMNGRQADYWRGIIAAVARCPRSERSS